MHYLVRGAGRCFAAIDSHRMIHGPLHGESVRRFEEERGWRWVTHDLSRYVGHRVHLEFTPLEGATDFAVSRVVEGPEAPPLPSPWDPELLALSPEEHPGALASRLRAAVRGLAAAPRGSGTSPRHAALLDWIARHPELVPGLDRDAIARAAAGHLEARARLLAKIQAGTRAAPAMLDGSGVNERVHVRGNASTPGEIVPRRLPVALPGCEAIEDAGSGRLELARRLTRPENPLVARVLVNRVWHHLFGRGLVSSVDDFGLQGSAPSHPELLDHLATRFVREGWSLKRLVREIVLSSTYRQSLEGDPRGLELDPKNLLLGRAPVRRLTAEAIRDGALAVSGALDPTLYGPSIPVHLDEFMEGRGRPSESGPVDGEGRRSLYVSVPRNFLSPFFRVFDRPIPFTTQGRRSVSNVPAQSLALMNDPLFEELAERWATQLLDEQGASTDAERIEALYLAAFSRPPSEHETRRLVAYLDGREDTEAWANVCHVLFNVKEFIFLN